MTIKLMDNQEYKLKGTHEIVGIHKNPDGSFWYWKDYNSSNRELITVTKDDLESIIESIVYLSRGREYEIEIGDIVVYIKGGWNSSVSTSIGQVIGFKNTRVTVRFGELHTSNLAPNNLLVVTEKKLKADRNWMK